MRHREFRQARQIHPDSQKQIVGQESRERESRQADQLGRLRHAEGGPPGGHGTRHVGAGGAKHPRWRRWVEIDRQFITEQLGATARDAV